MRRALLAIVSVVGLVAACSYDWTITAADSPLSDGGSSNANGDASDANADGSSGNIGDASIADVNVPDACSTNNNPCQSATDCCAGLTCAANNRCVAVGQCSAVNEQCGGFPTPKQCCLGMRCDPVLFSNDKCVVCKLNTVACAVDNDCCSKKCRNLACVP